MENISKQSEEELTKSLKQMREEQEEFERKTKRVLKEEEEEGIEINKTYISLTQMGKSCSTTDKKIQRLIEERLSMLNVLKKKKIEFNDEFLRDVKRQRQKMEEDMEEIRQQIAKEQDVD